MPGGMLNRTGEQFQAFNFPQLKRRPDANIIRPIIMALNHRKPMLPVGARPSEALRILFALAVMSFGLPLAAGAQEFSDELMFPKPLPQTTSFGISPFYGYRWGGDIQDANTDTKYSLKAAPAYGLILDYAPLGYRGRFELLWSRQDSSVDFQGNNGLGKVDITIDVIQAGGVAEYGSQRLRGYVSAHIGATHFSSDGHGDDTLFSFGIGAGVKAFLTKNIYLRADLRGFGTVTEAEGSFIFANGIAVATFSGSALWQGQVSAGIGITF